MNVLNSKISLWIVDSSEKFYQIIKPLLFYYLEFDEICKIYINIKKWIVSILLYKFLILMKKNKFCI